MRKYLTEEHKEKIRIAALKRKHTDESKLKISEKMKGNSNARKKVQCDEYIEASL